MCLKFWRYDFRFGACVFCFGFVSFISSTLAESFISHSLFLVMCARLCLLVCQSVHPSIHNILGMFLTLWTFLISFCIHFLTFWHFINFYFSLSLDISWYFFERFFLTVLDKLWGMRHATVSFLSLSFTSVTSIFHKFWLAFICILANLERLCLLVRRSVSLSTCNLQLKSHNARLLYISIFLFHFSIL